MRENNIYTIREEIQYRNFCQLMHRVKNKVVCNTILYDIFTIFGLAPLFAASHKIY